MDFQYSDKLELIIPYFKLNTNQSYRQILSFKKILKKKFILVTQTVNNNLKNVLSTENKPNFF